MALADVFVDFLSLMKRSLKGYIILLLVVRMMEKEVTPKMMGSITIHSL
jgi:hypothetical protein